jgi:methylmalonyl-CoA mutase N-terminal domain/subunit
MPYILEAVKAYASVGEIMEVLKRVHGAYREPAMV